MTHKLARIKEIHLYVGYTTPTSSADCAHALRALKEANIKYNLLNYSDHEEGQKATFKALSTWSLGDDAHKVECSDFPILSWDECFDDFTVNRRIAHGLQAILESDVLVTKVADKI